jgi:hypothetical protein
MGLTVRVYTDIQETNEKEYDFKVFTLEGFEKRVKNLKWRANYKGNFVGFFIQYPYSAHTYFRDILAELIGMKKDFWRDLESEEEVYLNNSELPFYELFDFADNEGCIDFESSKNLYTDFENYEALAKEKFNPKDYERYSNWKDAFFAAKDNGVVVFS